MAIYVPKMEILKIEYFPHNHTKLKVLLRSKIYKVC